MFETRSFSGEQLKNSKNWDIIRTHGETGRNEPKWGDLPVGRRETAGLQNSSMSWFQPQVKIIYCYEKSCVIFSVV